MKSNHRPLPNGAPSVTRVRFTELVDVNPKVDTSRLTPNDEVSFIPMSDVTDGGQWAERQTRQLRGVQYGYSTFQEGDILFAKITPCTENGKGCHATGMENGVGFGSTEFHVLRAKPGINPRIVYHISVSRDVRAQAAAMMGGSAGQQRVPPDFFKHIWLNHSWKNIQDQLACLLDSIDDSIEATRAVIEQTRRLKSALLQELLTKGLPGRHRSYSSIYRIGRIPADWTDARLGEVAEVVQGLALDPSRSPKARPTPYLRVANVQQGSLDLTEIKEIETSEAERKHLGLRVNDVLMVEGHANIEELGRAALLPMAAEGMVFQNHLFRVRPDPNRLDPRFLATWINSPSGRRYFKIFGGTTSGLNTVGSGHIRALRLPLPEIREQHAICDVLESLDDRIGSSEGDLNQLHSVKSALCQGLLAGRIPLRQRVTK